MFGFREHRDLDNHDQSPSRASTQSSDETKYDVDEKEYSYDYEKAETQLGGDEEKEKAKGVQAILWSGEHRPRTPPTAVTRTGGERLTSIDSYASGSSGPLSPTETLGANDRSFTYVLEEQDRFCTSPNKQGRTIQRKASSNIAAPAHIVAPPDKDKIAATLPNIRTRFDKPVIIGRKYHNDIILGPLSTKKIYEKQNAAPWQSHMHPDGLRYFYWKKGDCNAHHFSYLTDDNICDLEVRGKIEDFIAELEETADRFHDKLPENAEAVLQIEDNPDKPWQYYIADLDKKEILWMHNYDASWIADLLDGVDYLQQLKPYFDFEFWSHIEHFPCHRKIYPGLLDELMGYTTHGCIDTMTSLDSTAPYSASNMRDLSGLVKQLISLNRGGKDNEYIISASARLMSIIANERFWNFAGSHGARIVRDQSVRGVTYRKSWLIRILSPLLYFAPEVHLHSLEKIWVDGHITQCHWGPFLERLETDWEQFILYATVLLTANVSFLAIPTVISNQGPLIWASPAQIFSQVSIVCSLGCIILGLLLVRQHRRQTRESADDAAQFLERRSHRQLGREILAIMYSLPYALLMWGMLTFLPSIGITCFLNIQGSIEGLLPRVVYGFTWLSVLCLIFWTALTGWETTAQKSWRELVPFWGFWRRKREEDEGEGGDAALSDAVSICSTASSTRSWKRRIGKGFRERLVGSKKNSMSSLDGIILAGAKQVE